MNRERTITLNEEQLNSWGLFPPEAMTKRCHDHITHMNYADAIDGLEKNALEFIIAYLSGVEIKGENEFVFCNSLMVLYNAVHHFMETGSKADAFDIYYWFFVEELAIAYDKAKEIIEMLSDYESNASLLVQSHRDHYSHSVYVFLLGLAIYNSNSAFRKAYREKYRSKEEKSKEKYTGVDWGMDFFHFWGITSLFHDVGYIYEITFEQIKSYKGRKSENLARTYLEYRQVEYWTDLKSYDSINVNDMDDKKRIRELACGEETDSLDVVFANSIARHLENSIYRVEFDKEKLLHILRSKACNPAEACGQDADAPYETDKLYMDHAYFSAMIMFGQLLEIYGLKKLAEDDSYMDALTAIIMHNSLFKFVLRNDKNHPLHMEEHPLAYILMLCDELQAWDRTSFGRNSKGEMHAMGCNFEIADEKIEATYLFDERFRKYENDKSIIKKTLKKFLETENNKCKFYNDIAEIISLDNINLDIKYDYEEDNKFRPEGLNSTSLSHLYSIAVGLYCGYKGIAAPEGDSEMSEECKEFEGLPIEQKSSFINRAKMVGMYLNKIGCIYTDKPMGLQRVTGFSHEEDRRICDEEFRRLEEEAKDLGQNKPVINNFTKSIGRKYNDDLKNCKGKAEEARVFRELISNIAKVQDQNENNPQNQFENQTGNIISAIEAIDGMYIYRISSREEYIMLAELICLDEENDFYYVKPDKLYHRNKKGYVDYAIPGESWEHYMSDVMEQENILVLDRAEEGESYHFKGNIYFKSFYKPLTPLGKDENDGCLHFQSDHAEWIIDADGYIEYKEKGDTEFYEYKAVDECFVSGSGEEKQLYLGDSSGCHSIDEFIVIDKKCFHEFLEKLESDPVETINSDEYSEYRKLGMYVDFIARFYGKE